MYILQLFLHSIHIFDGVWIFKLLFFTLDCPIEFNEVVVTAYRLQSWFEVCCAEYTLGLVEKWINQSIYEAIC